MPSTTSPPGIHTGTAREQRFRDLFADVHDDVLRFAQRRVHPSQAEDVVADAFLIAWRRFDEAPSRLPDQRAWVYGITRNCLLNTRRGIERQGALAIRLADLGPATGLFDGEEVAARVDLARAWRALPAGDQEVLALSAFEGLTSPGPGHGPTATY